MPKHRRMVTYPLEPQVYQHRVEVVLQALAAAATAQEKLARFLLDQQGAEWRDLGDLIEAAAADFRRARQWLRKHCLAPTNRGHARRKARR